MCLGAFAASLCCFHAGCFSLAACYQARLVMKRLVDTASNPCLAAAWKVPRSLTMNDSVCAQARLATMRGELSTAQDTVETNAKKTKEILTWQHSSIFQTTRTKPSTSSEKQARSL